MPRCASGSHLDSGIAAVDDISLIHQLSNNFEHQKIHKEDHFFLQLFFQGS